MPSAEVRRTRSAQSISYDDAGNVGLTTPAPRPRPRPRCSPRRRLLCFACSTELTAECIVHESTFDVSSHAHPQCPQRFSTEKSSGTPVVRWMLESGGTRTWREGAASPRNSGPFGLPPTLGKPWDSRGMPCLDARRHSPDFSDAVHVQELFFRKSLSPFVIYTSFPPSRLRLL